MQMTNILAVVLFLYYNLQYTRKKINFGKYCVHFHNNTQNYIIHMMSVCS